MPSLLVPPNGLSLQSAADPTGNGQESAELIYRDPDTGEITRGRVWFQIHGGQKIREVRLGGVADDGVFELDNDGKIAIA